MGLEEASMEVAKRQISPCCIENCVGGAGGVVGDYQTINAFNDR